MVDACVPGDIVTVTGIVRVIAADAEAQGPKSRNKSMFVLYVDANSIYNSKAADGVKNAAAQALTMRDMYAVQEIAMEPHLFHLVVNSVCPAIFGHEVVKGMCTVCVVHVFMRALVYPAFWCSWSGTRVVWWNTQVPAFERPCCDSWRPPCACRYVPYNVQCI